MGKGALTVVVGPGAPGECFEECEVAGVFGGGGAEGADGGGLQQLGEDVGVWGGGGAGNEVGGGAGGEGGLGEVDVGFEGGEGFGLGGVHGCIGWELVGVV